MIADVIYSKPISVEDADRWYTVHVAGIPGHCAVRVTNDDKLILLDILEKETMSKK